MAVPSISPAFAANGSLTSSGSAPATGGKSPLGQTDFLKLLMAQMQHQDPLNPVSGADFAAQLAQFSSLQGVQQLNSSINQMLMVQQVGQAANLIGKKVTFVSDGKSLATSGVVSAVQISNGTVQLAVGTQTIALSQVTSISAAGTTK